MSTKQSFCQLRNEHPHIEIAGGKMYKNIEILSRSLSILKPTPFPFNLGSNHWLGLRCKFGVFMHELKSLAFPSSREWIRIELIIPWLCEAPAVWIVDGAMSLRLSCGLPKIMGFWAPASFMDFLTDPRGKPRAGTHLLFRSTGVTWRVVGFHFFLGFTF